MNECINKYNRKNNEMYKILLRLRHKNEYSRFSANAH